MPYCTTYLHMTVCHSAADTGQASTPCFGVLQVFMVASDNGTTYNGLAQSCSPVSRLPAVASGCPTTAFMDCYQVKKQPACPA